MIHYTKTIFVALYLLIDSECQRIKDEFFENIGDTMADVGLNRGIILMGDFNGRTGCWKNNDMVGSFGETTVNNNGRRLPDARITR